jgi:hypothetical protein
MTKLYVCWWTTPVNQNGPVIVRDSNPVDAFKQAFPVTANIKHGGAPKEYAVEISSESKAVEIVDGKAVPMTEVSI